MRPLFRNCADFRSRFSTTPTWPAAGPPDGQLNHPGLEIQDFPIQPFRVPGGHCPGLFLVHGLPGLDALVDQPGFLDRPPRQIRKRPFGMGYWVSITFRATPFGFIGLTGFLQWESQPKKRVKPGPLV